MEREATSASWGIKCGQRRDLNAGKRYALNAVVGGIHERRKDGHRVKKMRVISPHNIIPMVTIL